MANPEHVEILKQGAEVWNAWRKENPSITPDLKEAVLADKDLSDADLGGSVLSNADFSGTDLSVCKLIFSDLRAVNLQGADLTAADIRVANLVATNLEDAYMESCDLSFSNLIGIDSFKNTDLENATIGSTTFSHLDFHGVKNLDTIEHLLPSSIGLEVLYKCADIIPESFLRGCGIPEEFIKQIPSLISQPARYYSCFISYSSNDDEFATRIYNDLKGQGIRCWRDKEELKIGDRIRPRIEQSIQEHDKLLLILSEDSIASQWVEKEVETAFEKERRNPVKTVLFPIRVDDAVMDSDEAWAADIRRTRHIGDFSNWKDHDSYQKAFDRLMRDLKASEEG